MQEKLEPVMINAALVSAQNRKRLFWFGKLVGDKYEQANIPQPEDRGILLKDILEDYVVGDTVINPKMCNFKGSNKKSVTITATSYKEPPRVIGVSKDFEKTNKQIVLGNVYPKKGQNGNVYSVNGKSPVLSAGTGIKGRGIGSSNAPKIYIDEKYYIKPETLTHLKDWNNAQAGRIRTIEGKSCTLQSGGGGTGAKTGLYAVALRNRGTGKKPEIGGDKANAMTTVQTDSMVMENMAIRKLTPIECERLQSLPVNFTEGVSDTQRYKCLGNAFNVDVVAHILSFIGRPQKIVGQKRLF